ncbi:MAG TPA: ATPase, T2SS/T4P/T4SS family [Anaerohalosphaeraceae bacterium]|nr:ATPase, T2SS/T4P/T4SS family [Anaerohalosphaeraceae bacterium]HQG06992.1 ATPase, T2SS/T4P/T4SS family [Anaerohalosphaeraceae bacterium]HQI08581.1 ATPase, T2SS/T4P/T4SS family [Anaerohalosphaeraceae bacterium]HQJ68733.1 ATPase, T2SS/T4P/T4SS family [Anaerohalosphaeraceae bacterium]
MKRLFGKNKLVLESVSLTELEEQDGQIELAPGLRNLYCPEPKASLHVRDLADVLAEMGALTDQQLQELRSEKVRREELEKHLKKKGLSPEVILEGKARLYGYEFVCLEPEKVDRQAFGKLEMDYIRSNHLMPVSIEDGTLVLAVSDPDNVFGFDDVKRQTGMNVRVVVCTPQNIEAVCDVFDQNKFDYNVDEIISDLGEIELIQETEEDIEDLEKSAGESPVIKFVNYILSNALREGASDIHIEPKEKYTKIRYRIDGVLFEIRQAPAKMHPAIISRLKIMANLDISERRVPQDGKIAVIMGGRGIDLRVSVLPTSHGEKVVVRLLDSKSIMLGLDKSGMEPRVLEAFREQIDLPHGILLVTGPTGSGKSTTLYSALAQMDSERLNVSTVEDPVEYNLEYCNQVQVNEKTGMTFAAALRSLLRQDPDIIMIGEIRDQETARIAVQAALTGHLVLSTLHTNDAPSSVSRLVNIGVEPYLIAASLNAILAQRLVRRICEHCKESYPMPDAARQYFERASIEVKELVHGKGCEKCRQSGYSGRAGLFELLIVDEKFRQLIHEDPSVNSMRKAFVRSGWPTLFEDGLQKVKKGITTIEEVLRVTEEVRLEMGEEPPVKSAAKPSAKSASEKTESQPAEKKRTERARKKT